MLRWAHGSTAVYGQWRELRSHMAKGFLSRNMDFVLAIWDPWDLGREWCDEARIPWWGTH